MLILCATPIGNLGDITLRAVEALRACDVVYCEDTRHTLQLLNHLEIKKPMIACHQHNERMRAVEAAERVAAGQDVAYVSDAGMPGISDPGAALIAECIRRDLPVTVLPGASAVLTAAVLSGLPPQPFTFFGFLPRENKPRRDMLAAIAACGHLAILYESPLRVMATLQALYEAVGDCEAALLRELTKKFEEARRGRLSELIAAYTDAPPKGECVIAAYVKREAQPASEAELDAHLTGLLEAGASVRDAAAQAATALGVPKKQAYARALAVMKQP